MIEGQNLCFAYGTQDVLRNVNFHAAPGELTGILGANGSGKTTLLRLAMGLLRPTAGTLRVAGQIPSQAERRAFARLVAAVPQETPVEFPFTVGELVLLGRTPHVGVLGLETEKDVAIANEAMRVCGIRELAGRPITAVSGGELRRAFVARAFAQQAQILLCDEPTAGLDIHHQVALFELLRAEARAGRCVVVVVHDLNLAAAYCDHLLLLKQGQVVAEGTVENVLTYRQVRAAFDVDVYVGVNEVTGSRFLIPMADKPPSP
jgi:iron complex transport system ATP-binding protein